MTRTFQGVVLVTVLLLPIAAYGVPIPKFHCTLNDAASVTADNWGANTAGSVQGDPTWPASNIPPGTVAEMQSSGASIADWGTTEVDNIFQGQGGSDPWDKTQGITVDFYFSGFGDTGDEGMFSVGKRQGGDNFLIFVARDDEFRFNIRDEGGTGDLGGSTHTILTDGVNLNPAIKYRLTFRQHLSLGNGGDAEIFLESVSDGGAQYPGGDTPIITWDLPAGNFDFPQFDGGNPDEELRMRIGDKWPHFGGSGFELREGDTVDNVRVFNGVHLPSEIGPLPEPSSLLLLAGALPLLRRRRRA